MSFDGFRWPPTAEQAETAAVNHEVATYLVRSAQLLDLQAVADKLREGGAIR